MRPLPYCATIVVLASIVLPFLLSIPWSGRDGRQLVREAVAPVLAPMNSRNWEVGGLSVMGFTAQKLVVGTTGQIYVGAEEDGEGDPAPPLLEDLNEIVVAFSETMAHL